MNTENKRTIKRVISLHPFLAMSLLTRSDESIKELADKTRLSETFIRQNLQIIINWI